MDGTACSAMASKVQPSDMCTERTGRLALNSMISFMRTPKICELTPSAASESRNTAIGALLAGVMRVQAKGEMQLERTLKAAMSSAIERERPTMPILAAE